jgi:hypothetical protein
MEARQTHTWTNTRKLRMTGIMTQAVALHHFLLRTLNILRP